METVVQNLTKNNMEVFTVQNKEGVTEILSTLLKEGETVAVGGSKTLDEVGVLPYLRSGKFNFLDRYVAGLSREEIEEIFIKSFGADTYIASANAITEQGEIFNVDGNGNRVAAILYGPKQVILIAGKNKIVRDIDEAVQRVKTIAAPLNAKRLHCNTYCAEKGACAGVNGAMAKGCAADERICCDYTVMAHQRKKNRVKIILVQEDLGF